MEMNKIYYLNDREVTLMGGAAYGSGFALLVVLFILLIIIGASWIY
jgi:uncharacterized protein (TIGR01732 family)